MSRRSQDIPIRPRYGLAEAAAEEASERGERVVERPKPRRLTNNSNTSQNKSNNDEMASSYSEIPFLAQYPGAMGPDAFSDNTPTEENVGSHDITSENNEELDEDYDEEESLDDDDEANSKGSSTDGEKQKQVKRPNSLQYDSTFPYELERTNSNDGEMRHFVAENLEEQLRTASPHSRREHIGYNSHNSTPSTSTGGSLLTRHFLQTQGPQIDANAFQDIELEAQYLANSVDNLLENLCNLLHSISSITADNVEVHKNAVNKLTDSMDANIKCMYTIMAKTEEITKSMKPTEQLGQRIRDIKRLIDMLDAAM